MALLRQYQPGPLGAGQTQGVDGRQAGDFRMIVLLAQVGQHQHLGQTVVVGLQELRYSVVGQVSYPAHHPLLDEPRVRPHF